MCHLTIMLLLLLISHLKDSHFWHHAMNEECFLFFSVSARSPSCNRKKKFIFKLFSIVINFIIKGTTNKAEKTQLLVKLQDISAGEKDLSSTEISIRPERWSGPEHDTTQAPQRFQGPVLAAYKEKGWVIECRLFCRRPLYVQFHFWQHL